MSKVTISDFIIAFLDLVEAESRAFQESAELFFQRQREAFHDTLYKSSWMMLWIASAAVALLGALGFFAWGFYKVFALYISDTVATFATGGLLLVFAVAFCIAAMKYRRLDG